MITKYAAAAAVALFAMAGWSSMMQEKGVRKEQVRVETEGKKTHARVAKVRKAVEAKKPTEIRADLQRFCVDCR